MFYYLSLKDCGITAKAPLSFSTPSMEKWKVAAIIFISAMMFLMGPMMELVDIYLGKNIHWPFLTYTFVMAGVSVAVVVLIAAKWEKRTQEKNQGAIIGGCFVFMMLYLSATVFK